METKELRKWEGALSSDIEKLKKSRADIDGEIQQKSKKLELVRQMLSLETGGSAAAKTPHQTATEARTTPAGVREAARDVLTAAGRPLHINDIHRAFIDKGYRIPGSGTPFNILVHLAKSSGFVRVARGTYALAGTVPETQVLGKQPRRPKRKKATQARKTKEQ
jgi:hypothetical protein